MDDSVPDSSTNRAVEPNALSVTVYLSSNQIHCHHISLSTIQNQRPDQYPIQKTVQLPKISSGVGKTAILSTRLPAHGHRFFPEVLSYDRPQGPAQMSWKASLEIAPESGTMSDLSSTFPLEPTTHCIMPKAESHNSDASRCTPTTHDRVEGAQGERA